MYELEVSSSDRRERERWEEKNGQLTTKTYEIPKYTKYTCLLHDANHILIYIHTS